jgi:hypothetical protein
VAFKLGLRLLVRPTKNAGESSENFYRSGISALLGRKASDVVDLWS